MDCEDDYADDYGDCGDDEYDFDESVGLYKANSQVTLVWKNSSDIYEVIDAKVRDQMECMNLNFDNTLIVFHHFSWNRDKMEQEYFQNADQIQRKAGLLCASTVRYPKPDPKTFVCPVCFEKSQTFDHLDCNQAICTSCWAGFIKNKTLGKQAEMFFKCPFEGCQLVVPQEQILKYLDTKEEKNCYKRNLGRVFCEQSKTMKWCPSPGCDSAVENSTFTVQYVSCITCNMQFCFKCGKEHHSPCTCSTVAEWDLKNSSESENLRWIQLYTKLCPKCRKPIEKNQGCNHMTCRPPNGCGHEFCWLCLGDWKSHSEQTGGFYKCNKFENLNLNEKESKQKEFDREKSMLEKYIFYFERFNNNSKAEKKAKADEEKNIRLIKDLHDVMGLDQQYLNFINEANNFVIEGRRCLKWTYCYGFFLEAEKKELFEDQQSYLEKNIESLHHKIESTDYRTRFMEKMNLRDFDLFKIEIVNLTQAGIKFKKGILEAYESGNF